jgi:tripartite-type tricarboxylate transporter receptor subunit TctC
MLAEKLKDRVGQNVIVENRAGAGGATGTGYVAQQPGNGCILLLSYDTHAANPVLLQLPFDTIAAFKPVVMIGTIPNIIGAHPAQPYKTFAEMVAEAKREPDRLAYATGGTGTVAHLSMKQIEQQYGMQLRNVPYRGGAPAAADVVAGHVPMMVGSVQALGKFVQEDKVRALVQLGTKRHPMLPNTPTMDELGMKGFSSASWMGIFVPSSTPDAIVARFHDDLANVLGDSWVRERMASMGVELTVGSSAELGQFVKAELARWGDVVKRYNIKAE